MFFSEEEVTSNTLPLLLGYIAAYPLLSLAAEVCLYSRQVVSLRRIPVPWTQDAIPLLQQWLSAVTSGPSKFCATGQRGSWKCLRETS